MSSYVEYQYDKRIIAYIIMDHNSNEKQDDKSNRQQRDRHLDASIEHHSARDANVGP